MAGERTSERLEESGWRWWQGKMKKRRSLLQDRKCDLARCSKNAPLPLGRARYIVYTKYINFTIVSKYKHA